MNMHLARVVGVVVVALSLHHTSARPVSVCHDATYDVLVPGDIVCSGAGSVPMGNACPRKGDRAVDACRKDLPSFVDGSCVAIEDAVCQIVRGSTWGCVFPSIGCDKPVAPKCPDWPEAKEDVLATNMFEQTPGSQSFDGVAIEETWFVQETPVAPLYACNQKPTPAPTNYVPKPTPAASTLEKPTPAPSTPIIPFSSKPTPAPSTPIIPFTPAPTTTAPTTPKPTTPAPTTPKPTTPAPTTPKPTTPAPTTPKPTHSTKSPTQRPTIPPQRPNVTVPSVTTPNATTPNGTIANTTETPIVPVLRPGVPSQSSPAPTTPVVVANLANNLATGFTPETSNRIGGYFLGGGIFVAVAAVAGVFYARKVRKRRRAREDLESASAIVTPTEL